MSSSLGISINGKLEDSDELMSAMGSTCAAAKKAGKLAGCVAPTPTLAKTVYSQGYSLIVGGGDVPILREATPAKLAGLRQAFCD